MRGGRDRIPVWVGGGCGLAGAWVGAALPGGGGGGGGLDDGGGGARQVDAARRDIDVRRDGEVEIEDAETGDESISNPLGGVEPIACPSKKPWTGVITLNANGFSPPRVRVAVGHILMFAPPEGSDEEMVADDGSFHTERELDGALHWYPAGALQPLPPAAPGTPDGSDGPAKPSPQP